MLFNRLCKVGPLTQCVRWGPRGDLLFAKLLSFLTLSTSALEEEECIKMYNICTKHKDFLSKIFFTMQPVAS